MKMNDLLEAGKIPAILKSPASTTKTGAADDVDSVFGVDYSKGGKASGNWLDKTIDDVKFVANRMTGKNQPAKGPSNNVPSGGKIEPTGPLFPADDAVNAVATAEKGKKTTAVATAEKGKKTTAGNKSTNTGGNKGNKPAAKGNTDDVKPTRDDEIDDIRKNAGITPKAADDVAPVNVPKAADDVAPVNVTTAADDVAPVNAPSNTFKAKSPEDMEAELQATLAAQRQSELRAAQQAADDLAHQRELALITQRNQATQREIDALTGGGNKTATPTDTSIPQGVKDVASDFGKKFAKGAAYTAAVPAGAIVGAKTVDAVGNAAYGVTPVQSTIDAFKTRNAPPAAPAAPTAAEEPEKQKTGVLPDLVDSVDFKEILKLAGLKPITERDLTSGLTKAKPIMTLVENKNLSECGGMGMSTPTNATLNISASASTGEEVAGMLASILQLAGLKQVDASMMPQSEPMPMMKAMDIMTANPDDSMGAEDPTIIDVQMDDPQTPEDETDIDVVAGDPDLINGDEEEKKTQEGFEDATTKPNPTAMPGYGSWEQKFQRLSGDDMAQVPARSGDNPLKRSPAVKESVAEVDPVTHGLFKAYEAFKNGQ